MAVITEQEKCYHCGEACGSDPVKVEGKNFCCDGCKMVFELLSENNLCTYYNLDNTPGISPKILNFQGKYAFLDDPQTAEKIIRFQDESHVHVQFYLPQMHCSSCVWLLEHLYKLNQGITSSRVDFLRKEVSIEYSKDQTTLRKVVELLASIGYAPSLSLDQLENKAAAKPNRARIYRIAVAGFCFSNIMLLSFPEYFNIGVTGELGMIRMFNYLNLALSLPVLLYSGGEFFVSAWQGIKARFLNIDIPLALSIAITFGRSLYEIISGTGAGYLDSMSGIIFFMLLGRYFQEKTYSNLQFDRNFKSYFPISVSILGKEGETTIPLSQLKPGQRILIRSQEIVPADSRLLSGKAYIDYSFVTGESEPVKVNAGQLIYAGGRQTGSSIELMVEREVEQSYLTNLWNKDAFQEEKEAESKSFIHRLARNFTLFLLAISIGAYLFWMPFDSHRGLNALTTVLIVACPCALLLSATFTNGTVLRIFSKNKFYLKNSLVIEQLAKLNHLVFDKTGTITQGDHKDLRFEGSELDEEKLSAIYSLVRQSNHPLSKSIAQKLSFCDKKEVAQFKEFSGLGLVGIIDGHAWRVGSSSFIRGNVSTKAHQSEVHIECDGEVLGHWVFRNTYRESLPSVITQLQKEHSLSVISGDNDSERPQLERYFGKNSEMHFFQSPEDKLHRIEHYQKAGKNVGMIGDGLNDAGALRQSNVGIAVSDNVNNFSPACDAILEGESFDQLGQLLRFAKASRIIILSSFGISLLYNVIGISFAVQGELSPVVAAILMPISSVTIVLFTTGSSWIAARRIGLKH
ncbi:MAG: hypothetical protein RLZZ77_2528 [Bacteroidota bacterium]